MFGGHWVSGGSFGGSVVGCRWSVGRWRICRLIGGRLSVVGGFVIHLSSNAVYYSFLENLLIGVIAYLAGIYQYGCAWFSQSALSYGIIH